MLCFDLICSLGTELKKDAICAAFVSARLCSLGGWYIYAKRDVLSNSVVLLLWFVVVCNAMQRDMLCAPFFAFCFLLLCDWRGGGSVVPSGGKSSDVKHVWRADGRNFDGTA